MTCPLFENVLRKGVREAASDPQHAFTGQGVMKPDQGELELLKKENATLRIQTDLLNKAATYFANESMLNSASWRNIGELGRSQ